MLIVHSLWSVRPAFALICIPLILTVFDSVFWALMQVVNVKQIDTTYIIIIIIIVSVVDDELHRYVECVSSREGEIGE